MVLGGLAAIPTEPYERAMIDGASVWQVFRFTTLPLITAFLFIAAMVRMVDAVKSFESRRAGRAARRRRSTSTSTASPSPTTTSARGRR